MKDITGAGLSFVSTHFNELDWASSCCNHWILQLPGPRAISPISVFISQDEPIVVHLHVHSHFSPMRGVSSIPALIDAVRAQGGPAIALTDTNGLYGTIRFVEEARQAGLRPILGAELVTDRRRADL